MSTEINFIPIAELQPYENNPRNNEKAVEAVKNSIKEFGFQVPIVLDVNNIIIAGHTRYEAAKRLGLDYVPCIIADNLSEEQIRAYRLVDNKVAELSKWDFGKLEEELKALEKIDMSAFSFPAMDKGEDIDFSNLSERVGRKDEEYKEFEEKFKPKATTDDCFTPPKVYETIKNWVLEEYGYTEADIVRPFYPGGDYQSFDYPPGCIVLDNPPFSIENEIVKFYNARGIKYFLFAPTLTLFTNLKQPDTNGVVCKINIIYENGANVNTSFLTNLGEWKVRTAPELNNAVKECQKQENTLPKYEFPPNVITSARLSPYTSRLDIRVRPDECEFIDTLEESKTRIFGGGILLSDSAADKIQQDIEWFRNNPEIPEAKVPLYFTLSESEQERVRKLNERSKQ